MPDLPRALMIFSAGFGSRMGALSRDRPKPLIEVAGRPLIEHALDVGRAAGCAPIVANVHYRADQLTPYLEARGVQVSLESPRILDTGGGLRHAGPLVGPGAVFTLNSDAVWTPPNPLGALRAAWDPARMGALLMLVPVAPVAGVEMAADFHLGDDHRLTRGGPYRYTGAQIVDPAGLAEIEAEVFSLNALWDLYAAEGRLYGLAHPGGWCDVGAPPGIAAAEALLSGAADV